MRPKHGSGIRVNETAVHGLVSVFVDGGMDQERLSAGKEIIAYFPDD